jgi:hypothetical protein
MIGVFHLCGRIENMTRYAVHEYLESRGWHQRGTGCGSDTFLNSEAVLGYEVTVYRDNGTVKAWRPGGALLGEVATSKRQPKEAIKDLNKLLEQIPIFRKKRH